MLPLHLLNPPAPLQQETTESPGEQDLCAHKGLIFVPNGFYRSNFQHQRTSDCMCSRASSVTQLCLTQLCVTPWTSPPDSSEMGFPRQEHWSVLPCSPPGDLPVPGTKLASPTLAGGFFITEPPSECL